jgi:large subunit ribosomal protein L15
MPLYRRLPKRGFTNLFRRVGFVKKLLHGVKILGGGEISRPLIVKAHRFSRTAQEKIARAGGRVEVISTATAPGGGQPE